MSDFYINVIQHGNQLLVREVDKGKRVSRRVKWQPKLYVPSPVGSEWKTLNGQPLEPINFKSIKDARNFVQMHQDTPDSVYGLDNYQYVYIGEEYPDYVNWEMSKMLTITLDIEVECENGFPEVSKAEEPLLCVVKGTGKALEEKAKLSDLFYTE